MKGQQSGSRAGWRAVPALGLLVAFAVGCMRSPVPIPPQPMEAYAFRQRRAAVQVALDPYLTIDRLKLAFVGGEDFPRNGLLPVRVIIENGSGGEVQVKPTDFRLVRRDGGSDLALTVQDAMAAIKVSMGWWALGAPVGGGAVPAWLNENRMQSLEARAFKETRIPAGGSASGFVYFYLPESEKTLAGLRVDFALTEAGKDEVAFDIPVDGRREFLAPEARPAEVAGPPKPAVQTPLDPQNPQGPTRVQGTGGGVIIRSPAR